jgi:hypothetical protein
LRKTPIFRRKLTKIAENCDHNIDPGLNVDSLAMESPRFPKTAGTRSSIASLCLRIYGTGLLASRVARGVFEKINQNVAQPFFVKINEKT